MTLRPILATVVCGFTLLAQSPPPSAEVRKAAEQGDGAAQFKMGNAYRLGLGVTKDAAEALEWYRKAAEQGEPNAQLSLGFMYESGQGVAQDYPGAVRWYRLAAEQGNASAQFDLGLMYAHGRGVAQDYPEAVRWYRKAAEQGDATAQYNLGVMCAEGQGVAQDYPEAVRWYRKAAEQGEPKAQYGLGFMYTKGQGVAQDYPEAARWYRKAAEQGEPNAQSSLGFMYVRGQGVAQDYPEAVRWHRKAAEQGEPKAQYGLGVRYANGQGVAQDYPEAVRWYRKSAEQGNPNGQYGLGVMYTRGQGVAQDYPEAVRWFRKAAVRGEPDAQAALGFMYTEGQGVAQDYPEAVRWFRKSAEQGNPNGQYGLGLMYTKGQGVAQDYPEAVGWYRKAADQGNRAAQSYLGIMYAKGQGVAQDYPEAVRWYRKAAEQGEPHAQSALGFMYEKGQGVAQDYPEAIRWYRKAAEQGNAAAQFNLGLIYANGRGVTQDYVEAHMWLSLGASRVSGEEQNRRAGVRDTLAKKMAPQQIAEAERRAREWKPVEPSRPESTSRGPGSAENGGSAYRTPPPVPAQGSALSGTPIPGGRSMAGDGGISCVRVSDITSNKTRGGFLNREITDPLHHPFKTSQYVRWWAVLDSAACKSFPFAVRVTVHEYQDQAETMEVPFPPDQETALNLLIQRNERITVGNAVGVSPKNLKESHFTGVRVQRIVGDAGVKATRALQEAQVTSQLFCERYAVLRYTGKMTRSGPDLVPDSSQRACLTAQSTAMAERFMNEHAEVSSIATPILCADSTCVQSHLDNTVPNTTNVSKFIEGSKVYNAVRTFENLNATCEKCRGHWTATGIMSQAMYISGPGRPDYDEVDRYNFTCKTVMGSRPNQPGKNPYDGLPLGSVIPEGQIVAGKHSANDSYVTCSAQKIQ